MNDRTQDIAERIAFADHPAGLDDIIRDAELDHANGLITIDELEEHKETARSGTRRLTAAMLAARDQADGFDGLAPGIKPFQLLAALQKAWPYLGLPSLGLAWITYNIKLTRPCDWEKGSRPITWPTARRQQEVLSVSHARAKALDRVLAEAGLFVMRDDPQGRRRGRRGADGRIIEAYGFDWSLLSLRYAEFKRIAAEAETERKTMGRLRRRATIARRGIKQVGEALAALGALPSEWPRLEHEKAVLMAAKGDAEQSGDLAPIVEGLEGLRREAEQWLRDTAPPPSETAKTSPMGLENEPHRTDTNRDSNIASLHTVAASEGCSDDEATPEVTTPAPAPRKASKWGALDIRPSELLDLAPRLDQWVPPGNGPPTWQDIDKAAGILRRELGVSPSCWETAHLTMGPTYAAITLAIVSTKPEGYFTRSAGAYFARMVKLHGCGLNLQRSLMGLREAKPGLSSELTIPACPNPSTRRESQQIEISDSTGKGRR
jgi:replication initiation protein RepC